MDKELTIAELRELIKYLPDNATVRICNGHAIWSVTSYEYEANPYGDDYTGIILTNSNIPK